MEYLNTILLIIFLMHPFGCDSQGKRTFVMSPNLPQLGIYSHGVLVDNTLYISGQLGFMSNGTMVSGGIEAETRQALFNIVHVLNEVNASITDVVKTTVLLRNINDVAIVNFVYGKFFLQNYPARATYEVSNLLLDASVEIEAVAVLEIKDANSIASRLRSIWVTFVSNCIVMAFTTLYGVNFGCCSVTGSNYKLT